MNGDNSTKADLLTGGIDEFFARTANGVTSSFIADALGSTLALTDSAGSLTTQYSYEAYGNTTQSGAASDNPFQYTGRENDGTGLYYYRSRYLDPELSRFISEDPLGFGGGDVNLAAYVFGDPVSLKDPTGEIGVAGAVFGAIAGGVSGYVTSGSWQGAAIGAAAGAAVGLVNPWGSYAAGAFAGGVASSAVGQMATNYFVLCNRNSWWNINMGLAAMSGFGNGAARLFFNATSSPTRSAFTHAVNKSMGSGANNSTVGVAQAAARGTSSGFAQYGYMKNDPTYMSSPNSCSCQ